MPDKPPFPALSTKAAIAAHFGFDIAEMEDRRYQPTRNPFPVYTVNEDYYTATRGKRPPKAHGDWSWHAVPSTVTAGHGNTIWIHHETD